MFGRYESYFQTFYVKQFEWWKEVYSKTGNKEAKRRKNEIKSLLYKNWLVEIEDPEDKKEMFGKTEQLELSF